jgi:bisphosphoglycerate-dependent phosphoglycerate mutase
VTAKLLDMHNYPLIQGQKRKNAMNDVGKQKIRIFTRQFEIAGDLHIYSGARLTDFMNESKDFISVTDVEVRRPADGKLISAKFLNVRKDVIEIILPEENIDSASR